MYFLQVSFRNASMPAAASCGSGARATISPSGRSSTKRRGTRSAQLIAAACGGVRIVPRLNFDLQRLGRAAAQYFQIELVLALFAPYEASGQTRSDNLGAFVGTELEVWRRWET